nr:MAG TPA: hypothetical protein [Caudoviricetes sp.]
MSAGMEALNKKSVPLLLSPVLPRLSWGGRTYQVNEPRFMDNALRLEKNTSEHDTENVYISEWVVNKTEWTCEFDVMFLDKFVNWEWPIIFCYQYFDDSNPYIGAFRLEYNVDGYSCFKGEGVEAGYADARINEIGVYLKYAVSFTEGTLNIYLQGKKISENYKIKSSMPVKCLSKIILGYGGTNGFNGCIKNFRFSSTVHTAEKIAADSKLDELPVEEDTVLYMPLKKDLSMYGHYYND